MWLQKFLYGLLRKSRAKKIMSLADSYSKTVLDIGCQDTLLADLMNKKYCVSMADLNPTSYRVMQADIEDLPFRDNQYDIIVCQQVLEHTHNPIKAMQELKRVAKKQIIVSVPNEPFFTLTRFGFWEKVHLWAITPKALECVFGKPDYSETFFFKRYYFASWVKKVEK